MRLIDADHLKQEIRKGTRYFVRVWDTKGRDKWEMERDLSQRAIYDIIDNAPTIEANESREKGKWNYCPYCGVRLVNDEND